MNRTNLSEFFDARKYDIPIHIIGVGAIGSTLLELLVRCGFTDISIYDFDTVEAKNVANQMFRETDIGKTKTTAMFEQITEINSECAETINVYGKLEEPYTCSGYIFMCVDSVKLRNTIVKANMYNKSCIGIFDFRMRLTDAQHYAYLNTPEQMKELLKTMDFTSEEAKEATPMSACGVTLSVAFTVRAIVAFGVANFIKYLRTDELQHLIMVDMEDLGVLCL